MTEHRNRGRHLPGAAARYAGLLVVPILGLGLVACGGSGEPALRTRPLPRRNSSGPSAPVMRQPRAALAPESRNEVAESGKSACANAISEVELTPGGPPVRSMSTVGTRGSSLPRTVPLAVRRRLEDRRRRVPAPDRPPLSMLDQGRVRRVRAIFMLLLGSVLAGLAYFIAIGLMHR